MLNFKPWIRWPVRCTLLGCLSVKDPEERERRRRRPRLPVLEPACGVISQGLKPQVWLADWALSQPLFLLPSNTAYQPGAPCTFLVRFCIGAKTSFISADKQSSLLVICWRKHACLWFPEPRSGTGSSWPSSGLVLGETGAHTRRSQGQVRPSLPQFRHLTRTEGGSGPSPLEKMLKLAQLSSSCQLHLEESRRLPQLPSLGTPWRDLAQSRCPTASDDSSPLTVQLDSALWCLKFPAPLCSRGFI
ncbi:PREDICTED: uncharacterized protein LOC102009212 [Chinchilla lanigera]|uniref:uncharacterized protein LOC102009212 n=1 Tax=Chinchilla lanigera TaxID=34839 RepID=UPI0006969566|nr:PREDICTED: uncharacterized protein LOC102009212 [Chinchilla lanigera]